MSAPTPDPGHMWHTGLVNFSAWLTTREFATDDGCHTPRSNTIKTLRSLPTATLIPGALNGIICLADSLFCLSGPKAEETFKTNESALLNNYGTPLTSQNLAATEKGCKLKSLPPKGNSRGWVSRSAASSPSGRAKCAIPENE